MSESNTTIEPNACSEDSDGDFNLTLHVVSVFALLLCSFIGVFFPIITKRFMYTKIKPDSIVLIFGKFFGGGIMVSTAFIHILPAAVESLSNPCLPEFFTERYPALPYLITMVSALFLHLLEWITVRVQQNAKLGNVETSKDKDKNSKDSCEDESNGHGHGHGHAHAHRDQAEVDAQIKLKAKVSLLTLEAAIAIHSVIIGIALGIATDEFISLWIALGFHQFFEGIGIGFRIADSESYSNTHSILTGLFFSITAPVGAAIGIGITLSSSQASVNSIVAEGILEAIAGGLLLYSALVSVTVEEFSASSFHTLKYISRVVAFTAFYLGIVAMAVIGIWA